MQITEEQYQRIEECLPRQRGNVKLSNLQVTEAVSNAALLHSLDGMVMSGSFVWK